MKKIRLTILTVLIGNILFAGSPLIQTKFYSEYYLNEKVQLAEQLEFLDGTLAGFINDQNVPVDQKLAVLNALQWNEKGKNNVDTYKMLLGRKYGKSYDQLNLDEMNSDELLCLGYMVALDHQRKLDEALPVLEKAKNKNPGSFTVQLIYSLAKASDLIRHSENCEAWKMCNDVRYNQSLTRDFNPDAIEIVFQAVDAYKNSCE